MARIKQVKHRLFTKTEKDKDGNETVTKQIDFQVKTTDAFYIGYLEHIGFIAKLPHYQLQTLLCITKILEYQTGEFQLGEKDMVVLTECSGLKEGSIRSAVSHLKRKNILQSKGRNWYAINPGIMWKGNETNRQSVFELTWRWQVVGNSSTKAGAIKPNTKFTEETNIIEEKSEE